jgi:hypothetical protein
LVIGDGKLFGGGAGAEVFEEFSEGGFEGVVVFPVLEVAGDVVFAEFAGEVFAGVGVEGLPLADGVEVAEDGDYKSHITNHISQITDHKSQITNHRSQNTDYRLRPIGRLAFPGVARGGVHYMTICVMVTEVMEARVGSRAWRV